DPRFQPLQVSDQRIEPRQRIAEAAELVEHRGDVAHGVVLHQADAIVVVAADLHSMASLLRSPEIMELSSRKARASSRSLAVATSSSMRARCTLGSRSSSMRLLRIDIACTCSTQAARRWRT